MIDEVSYKSPNFHKDTLQRGSYISWGHQFEYEVRINDFSFAIPQSNYFEKAKKLEIKIIRNKDTMFICQSSGAGSLGSNRWPRQVPIQLQFIPGKYYFPTWTKKVINNPISTTGKVKFRNMNQRNFLVSKSIYNSQLFKPNKYRYFTSDAYVLNNFTKGNFSIRHYIEPTTFDTSNSAQPYNLDYKQPSLFTSQDGNNYYGFLRYERDTRNCSNSKSFFSILNRKKNSVKQWFPNKNPRLFSY